MGAWMVEAWMVEAVGGGRVSAERLGWPRKRQHGRSLLTTRAMVASQK